MPTKIISFFEYEQCSKSNLSSPPMEHYCLCPSFFCLFVWFVLFVSMCHSNYYHFLKLRQGSCMSTSSHTHFLPPVLIIAQAEVKAMQKNVLEPTSFVGSHFSPPWVSNLGSLSENIIKIRIEPPFSIHYRRGVGKQSLRVSGLVLHLYIFLSKRN
jgi:hypothetical protein